MTAAQMFHEAEQWATGHKSHLNEMMGVEAAFSDRTATLARCAEADAAEVVKWTHLAVAARALQQMGISV